MPTILVCPLPIVGLPHEQLLPELSHELKTPLTGIMGLAQVLQRYPSPMADREHQYAELIYQKSQQLLVSINDLFDLAQLCTHQFVLQLRPVELFSVVKTALKVVQYTTDAQMPTVEHSADSPDDSDLWMMGDLPRLEQLLTHLIGYFSVQGVPDSHPVLKLQTAGAQRSQSQESWISITLVGTLREESAQAQDRLSWPHQPLDFSASAMPGRSGAVLKFLLAKQLAQLHGGDVSWIMRSSLETEVTVLLPRDLTRATVLTRPRLSSVFLIYAHPNAATDDVVQMLRSQGALVAIGRSPDEIQEKVKILFPVILVLDSCCVEAPEWPALMALLTGQSAQTLVSIVWLNTAPIHEANDLINVLDVWPLPLASDQIARTLRQIHQTAGGVPSPPATVDSNSTERGLSDPASRALIVLQIDPVVSARPPETIFVELLTCLSRDFGCSILAVDDPEQAELLAQIWKPRAMICTESAPPWAMHFSEPSVLAALPLFLLCLEEREPRQSPKLSHCRAYPIDRNAAIQNVAQHLYQALTAVAKARV